MTASKRLMRLEENPDVQYRQELARLRRQEARPLEEVYAEIKEAPDKVTGESRIADLTEGQFLRIFLEAMASLSEYETFTQEEYGYMEGMLERVPTLEQQSRNRLDGQMRVFSVDMAAEKPFCKPIAEKLRRASDKKAASLKDAGQEGQREP